MLSLPNPGVSPRFVSKADTIEIVGSKKLVDRMLHASKPQASNPWLRTVPLPLGCQCRDALIDLASINEACDRLLQGEHPPLFPSEVRRTSSFNNEETDQ